MGERGRIVVIGVGNRYRSDDAAGPCVLDLLSPSVPRHVSLIETEGDCVSLLDSWTRDDEVVVVDAMVSGKEPGTLEIFRDDLAGHRQPPRASSHHLGLVETLALARTLQREPGSVVLIGIEAATVQPGTEISPEVAVGVERAARMVACMWAHPSCRGASDA